MKLAKKKSGLVAVQLDISKAFDTVPHQAIEDALTKKGIPQYIAKLTRGSYKEVNTIISAGTTEVKVDIRRGVKQCDPLSPFISNALMEPLISELEKQKWFQINE
jgi:DNA-binding ferritin-like protein